MQNIEFVDILTLYLNQLIDLKIPLIVAGDLNINLLNPNIYAYVDLYVGNLFEQGMKPLITLHTKVNIENHITRFSIIDHIWISEGLSSDSSFVIPIDITDHFPVISIISATIDNAPSLLATKRRRLVIRGKETFRILLLNIHVNIAGNGINNAYNEYFRKVFEGYNRAFPIQRCITKNKRCSPWITPRLKECIKKEKLYRAYLKGHINKADYRLTNVIRRSKALCYEKNIIGKCH